MRSQPELEVLGPEGPVTGTKVPLLFVHGLGHEAHCWDNWRSAATAAGYPAYALSLRGHGNSQGSVRRSVLSHYRDDVLRVVDSLPAPPVLIGHSMGGLVSAMAMSRRPVAGVVLVASVPAGPALRSFLGVLAQHPVDALGMLVGRSLPIRYEYCYEHLAPELAQASIDRCRPESPWVQHQLVVHRPPAPAAPGTPMLVIGTTADRLIPIKDVRATARHYGAELAEFDGRGHNLMQDTGWEAPWGKVSAFLEGSVAARADQLKTR